MVNHIVGVTGGQFAHEGHGNEVDRQHDVTTRRRSTIEGGGGTRSWRVGPGSPVDRRAEHLRTPARRRQRLPGAAGRSLAARQPGNGSRTAVQSRLSRARYAATGQILWDFTGQGSSVSGAAIVDGVVYWGNGYSHLGPGLGTASTTFYAFKLGK